MDWAERKADEYLRAQGFTTVFEPDGNVPPDFSLDGSIAVEVRRLNENRGGVGLDVDSVRLHDSFRDVLRSFGTAHEGVSWWVSFGFRRPLTSIRHIKSMLRGSLNEFIAQHRENARFVLGENDDFDIQIARANIPLANRFELAGIQDHDSGGAVTALLIEDANTCIEQKMRKIEPYRHKYPAWWLVLVNTTGYRLHPDETDVFIASVKRHNWSKVVFLGLPDLTKSLEI